MVRMLVVLIALLWASPLRAVENTTNSLFNSSAPTSTDISNWTSGWSQPTTQPTGYTSTTGWNYVGSVGGNSAVYMGNNWVLTAAHVGVGNFSLNGVAYPAVAGTTHTFGTADLVLFQISPAPDLPGIPLRSTAPIANASPVAIIGWGDGGSNRVETWGYNDPINFVTQPIPLTDSGVTYTSTDFVTLTETTSSPPKNTGNPYEVQVGDSGGADFIYNTTTSRWELAGINEGDSGGNTYAYPDGTYGSYSVFVQLSAYASSITPIIAQPLPTDTPTMPLSALLILAGLLVALRSPAGSTIIPSDPNRRK